jgi:hypothetical protein
MNGSDELSPEQASRLAITALVMDLQAWACTASVDGAVHLADLTRALDIFRDASVPAA